MAYDLLIRNGRLIDGTGAPAFHGNVAVADGRIVGIGDVDGLADEVIDASDCVVSPGFIDPHTHYDAQICWDSDLTPSSWHGVTSVMMGNCGVGLAPCLPAAREIAMRDLVNVEAIPYEVLNKGITWDWESFPEYMRAAESYNPSLNIAFLAPLTPFRHYVMGEESMERAATPDETAKIAGLLGEAMDMGAFGFSSTVLNQHLGFGGRPLACRLADDAELTAYSHVLRDRNKGAIEVALTRQIAILEDEQSETLDLLLRESGRPVTFIAMFDRDDIPEAVRDTLRKAAPMIERGARPQTSPLPLTREVDMRSPFSFAAFPSWKRVFADKSLEAQKAVYSNKAFRDQFRNELATTKLSFGSWERVTLHEVFNPDLKKFEGRTVAEIARTEGRDPVDVFLDNTVADDLRLEYTMATFNTRVDRMVEILNNPAMLIGLGDGGAHVDMLCDSGYPTFLLGHWVREHQAITLEEGVRRLTTDPANFYGIADRGRLKEGLAADIAIFDPAGIGSSNRGERRHDLPGGGKRMVMPSRGVEHTIVNGQVTYKADGMTGARAGEVLRS
jgi:N-acyl-D-amino-acid deacylase